MFGFLNPRPHSLEYRRVYARLCQQQHVHYGLRSLAFHSFEAVFLYQCAVDAGAVDASKLPNQRCCKLMTRGSIRQVPDAEVGRFCASFALLLASVKLEDDLRDAPSLLARVGRWLLRRRIAGAMNYFTRLDPRFRSQIDILLNDHRKLEERGGSLPLDEYVEPTALAFGYVFGLMAKLRGMADQRETLTALGRKLGAAIIAFDCAVDWKRDRQRGEFNPLAREEDAHEALLMSAAELAAAAGIARHAFGAHSSAARTLDAVRERVLRRNIFVECESPPLSVWARIKGTVQQSFRLLRTAAAVPVMMASSNGGDAEEPPRPDDGERDKSKPPASDKLTREQRSAPSAPSNTSDANLACCACNACFLLDACGGC